MQKRKICKIFDSLVIRKILEFLLFKKGSNSLMGGTQIVLSAKKEKNL